MKNVTRRNFLQLAGLGTAGIFTATRIPFLTDQNRSVLAQDSPAPDVEIALKALPTQVNLFSGQPTRVWSYQGEVLRGDPAILQTLPDSYLGPILRVSQGQRVRVHFTNGLPEKSILHWHGFILPAEMDGHPRYAIQPGQTFVYEFLVINRAGTYWYHPHPDKLTGRQVYQGLAGLVLVSDEEEKALGLPAGEYDLPLVVQDRTFDGSNQLSYQYGGMMGGMPGFLGNRILVNGKPNFSLSVATRVYRLRLINGSNARVYQLAWNDGTPLTVIGTDGGLLETPVQRSSVTLAPGERVELWVDFQKYPVGAEIKLESQAFSNSNGMMGGQPTNAPMTVLTVKVARQESDNLKLPPKLSSVARYHLEDAVNMSRPRTFSLSMNHMRFLLNGRTFEMGKVADNEVVPLNALEVWEFVNQSTSRGMMAGMMHPIHVHGVQFQIIERQITPQFAMNWETVRAGYVDEGWKDTVLVMPGERVKLLIKFGPYSGLFLYHCHNLEHEDAGMMRNLQVKP